MSADSFVRDSSDSRPIVLCCGDSITHGHIGYDWVGALREKDSSKIYVNAGINGDLAWNLNQRLENKLNSNLDQYFKRLDYELSIIIKMGFAGYF